LTVAPQRPDEHRVPVPFRSLMPLYEPQGPSDPAPSVETTKNQSNPLPSAAAGTLFQVKAPVDPTLQTPPNVVYKPPGFAGNPLFWP
jgi:hypothetical protein